MLPRLPSGVPAEIQGIIEKVDQHVTIELDIGASVNDILTEEDAYGSDDSDFVFSGNQSTCHLYISDVADELPSVDFG